MTRSECVLLHPMPPTMILHDMNIWDHLVAAVVCIVAPVMAYSSRRVLMEDIKLTSDDKIRLYHSNALLLTVFALVVITVWRIPGRTILSLGFDWPVWNVIVLGLIGLIVLFYCLDIFLQYGRKKSRERLLQEKTGSFSFIPADRWELSHFSFLALAAGIGEEIVFRGYLIQYLLFWTGNDLVGMIVACFFSSALFAFLHGYQGYTSMLKIFFLALVFSALFIYSQSLIIVIIIHALIDLISGYLGVVLLKEKSEEM